MFVSNAEYPYRVSATHSRERNFPTFQLNEMLYVNAIDIIIIVVVVFFDNVVLIWLVSVNQDKMCGLVCLV